MRSLKCEYKTIIQIILLLFIVQVHYFFCWRVVGGYLKSEFVLWHFLGFYGVKE